MVGACGWIRDSKPWRRTGDCHRDSKPWSRTQDCHRDSKPWSRTQDCHKDYVTAEAWNGTHKVATQNITQSNIQQVPHHSCGELPFCTHRLRTSLFTASRASFTAPVKDHLSSVSSFVLPPSCLLRTASLAHTHSENINDTMTLVAISSSFFLTQHNTTLETQQAEAVIHTSLFALFSNTIIILSITLVLLTLVWFSKHSPMTWHLSQ